MATQTNVSSPVRPKPVEEPTPTSPPEPDYTGWLPSEFLSRGWCRNQFWEYAIDNHDWHSTLAADRYCVVGALMAAEAAGTLDHKTYRRLVRATTNVLRARGYGTVVGYGRGAIELWNDEEGDAETALDVLREAERKVGLR